MGQCVALQAGWFLLTLRKKITPSSSHIWSLSSPVSCSCFHKISHLRLPIKPQGCKRRKAQEESIAVLICAAWNSKQKGDGNIHNIWPVNCAKNTACPKSTWSAQCEQKRWRCMLWNGLCLKSNACDLHARFSSFLQSSCHSGETGGAVA